MSFLSNMTKSTIENKIPVPYVGARGVARSTFQSHDKLDQMRAMGAVGTLFAIVNVTSEAISMNEWKLFRKTDEPGRRYSVDGVDDRTEVTKHQALNVWNKPNPFMTRQEFVESYEQHRLLTGEAWWLPQRPAGISFPTALYLARPDRMDVVPSPTDFLSGYVYRSPDGVEVPLDTDEVIQLRTPNPCDPYRGWGPVQSVLADLDATRLSAEWNRQFFLNSAEPGGLIEVPEPLEDEDFRRLKNRWNEQHQGIRNAHRVSILEGGMKWIDRTISQRDMQFVELRGVASEVIREAFHFPKPMLGTVEDVNRANAEAAEVVFARWLTRPALERTKQALNNDFLPMFGSAGKNVEFDYCNPVPDDREQASRETEVKTAAYVALCAAGADPLLVAEYLELPDLGYKAPAPPVVVAPAAPGTPESTDTSPAGPDAEIETPEEVTA